MVTATATAPIIQTQPKQQAVVAAPAAPAPMPSASVPMGAETIAEAEPMGVSRLQRLSLSLPSEKVEQVPEPFQPAQEQRQSGTRFMLRSFLGQG